MFYGYRLPRSRSRPTRKKCEWYLRHMRWAYFRWTLTLVLAGCGSGAGAGEPAGDSTSSGSTAASGDSAEASAGDPAATTLADEWCDGGSDTGWSGDGDDGAGSSGGDDSGGGGSGDGPVGMDDDMPLAASTFEIQQGRFGPDEFVVLQGVVVTAPPIGEEILEVFVQDTAGGPWSGLRVRFSAADVPSPPSPGDTLDVTGRVEEALGRYRLNVRGGGGELAVVGTATLPTPGVVASSALVVGDDVGWSWKDTPIRLEEVMVTHDDPCDGVFVIDATARVDDRFVPSMIAAPEVGSQLDAIEGVLVFGDATFSIAPRTPAEIQ
jgi:hypothetical protein